MQMNEHVKKLLAAADAARPDVPNAGLCLEIEAALVARSGVMGSIILSEGLRRNLRLQADECSAKGDDAGYSDAMDRIAAIDKEQRKESEESKALEVELKRLRKLWAPKPPAPCAVCGHQKSEVF